jgi:hypothetical protein
MTDRMTYRLYRSIHDHLGNEMRMIIPTITMRTMRVPVTRHRHSQLLTPTGGVDWSLTGQEALSLARGTRHLG